MTGHASPVRPTGKHHSVRIRAVVPPGKSLVGTHMRTIFRAECAELVHNPSLHLFHAEGFRMPFDGRIRGLTGISGTTLTVGNLLAFAVRNDSAEPQPLEMVVHGTAVEVEDAETIVEGTLGLFAQEAEWSAPLDSPESEGPHLGLDPEMLELLAQEVGVLDDDPSEGLGFEVQGSGSEPPSGAHPPEPHTHEHDGDLESSRVDEETPT